MNKKFKSIILLLIAGIFVGIFSACGENPEVKFKQNSCVMAVGYEIEIDDILEYSGIDIGDIKLKTSNAEIVYIKPNGNLVSRSEGVAVITADGFSNAVLEISVYGLGVNFSKPTNLCYNQNEQKITWDTVYESNTVATEYEVKLTSGRGALAVTETHTVNTNSLPVNKEGALLVSVKALAKNGVGASEFSNEYSFTILSSPYNLTFNDNTKKLEWNAELSISKFKVSVNGIITEVDALRSLDLELANAGTYEIQVGSFAQEENVFGKTSEEKLVLRRMPAPDLSISNGELMWTNYNGANGYHIVVSGASSKTFDMVDNLNKKCRYAFEDLIAGQYSIEIYAKGEGTTGKYGNGEHTLKGDSTTLTDITKLASPEIDFIKEEEKINVVGVNLSDNQLIVLTETNSDSVENVYQIENGEKSLNLVAGVYEYSAIRQAKNDNEIKSNPSNSVVVCKFGQAKNIRQEITQGTINNQSVQIHTVAYDVDYATPNTSYAVQYYDVTLGEPVSIPAGSFSIDEIFDVAGQYGFSITAYQQDTVSGNLKTYYISSVTMSELTITRLQNVTLENDNENDRIIWEAVEGNNITYSYELVYDEDVIDSGVTSNTYFNYPENVGTYTLKVFAQLGGVQDNDNLVLRSLLTAEIEFDVEKVLQTPVLNFVKQDNNYYILIQPDDCTANYSLTLNAESVNLAFDAENSRYCVTSLLTGASEWEFGVVAHGINRYYLDSEQASIVVNKLNSPSSVTLSTLEVLQVNGDLPEGANSASILVKPDGENEYEEIASLNDSASSYFVKVKYISKNGKVNGIYYIDSDEFEFTLTREVVESDFDVETSLINFVAENSDNFSRQLIITDGAESLKKQIALLEDSISIYDIIHLQEVNIQDGIKIYAKYNILQYLDISSQDENSNYVISSVKTFSANILSAGLRSVQMSENADNFVSILQMKVQGATYENGSTYDEKVGEKIQVPLNEFTTEVNYEFAFKETMQNGTVNILYFSVEKLNEVTKLNIEDEVLSYNVPEISNGISLKLGGIEIDDTNNLSNALAINSQVSVFAKLIGKQLQDKMYLSSDETEFKFARLEKYDINFANAITITSNEITIVIEADETNTYKIVFAGDDDEFEKEFSVLNIDSLQIDISVSEFINQLEGLGDNKYFNITKLSGIQEANAGDDINYLDSVESNNVIIKMLSAPTNIQVAVVGDADRQTQTQTTWEFNQTQVDNGYEIDYYNVKFSLNGTAQGTEEITSTTLSLNALSAYLVDSGVWGISVQTVGRNDTISSIYSEEIFITRLNQSSKIEITKTGLISFVKVNNASGYILELNDVTSGVLDKVISLGVDENSYQLTDEELALAYNGEIAVTLYAIGDGTEYLSSCTKVSFERLEIPNIQLTNKSINVIDFNENSKIIFTAVIDENIVASGELVGEVNSVGTLIANYPSEYSYMDNGTKVPVDFSTNKDITFTFYATSTNGVALDSNSVTIEATILSNYDVLGFKRDGNDLIHLYILNEDNIFGVTNVTLSNVNGSVRTAVVGGDLPAEMGVIDIVVYEEMLKQISSVWEVSYYAVGGIDDDRVYIDSAPKTISGTKLNTVSGISTNQGKLVWSQTNGATKYSVYVNGEKYSETTTQNEEFVGLNSSDYLITVRAYGNVAEEYVLDDVVLDSSLQEVETTITKLPQITNINARLGFIVLDEISYDGKYMLVLYDDLSNNPIAEYELSKHDYESDDETFSYYFNSGLRQKLTDGNVYYAKFYYKAINTLDINSDFSEIDVNEEILDYIRICQFANDTYSITLSHPEDGGVTTYTITNAEIELGAGANNGYLLKIDDDIEYKLSDDTLVRLDKDEDWTAGTHKISYAQIGSNNIDEQRTIYLTPDFGAETIVTKLGVSNVELTRLQSPSQILIIYSSVTSADSYYLYLGDSRTIQRDASGVILPDEIPVGIYDDFSVRAINKHDPSIIAGDKSFLKVAMATEGEGGEQIVVDMNLRINKPKSPDEMTQTGGALRWEIDDISLLMNLMNHGYCTDPYYMIYGEDGILDRKIYITFTSTDNNQAYTYQCSAYNFLYFTDSLLSTVEMFSGEAAEYLRYFQNGFPSENFGFIEFASGLPAGEYTVKYSVLGNEMYAMLNGLTGESVPYLLITSGTTEIKDGAVAAKKYVPSAPTGLNIVNENDVYKLKFNSVSVSNSYLGASVKYALVASYDDEDGLVKREIITTLQTTEKTDGKPLEFNLTDLVNSSKLLPKHKSLMIYVYGDDGNVLSGKVSNIIPITVLEEITAHMEHGQLHIHAQEGASKYVINLAGKVDPIEIASMPDVMEYIWNGDDSALTEGLEYAMTIYAYGSSSQAEGNMVISGKVTNLGKIVKLGHIDNVDVVDGIFNWANISNAVGYDVYCSLANTTTNVYETIANNFYNTKVKDTNLYSYYFMAVGTNDVNLNSETKIYLNSTISSEYKARRVDDITNIKMYDGIVTWESALNNESGVYYLLTITGEGKEPIIVEVGNISTVASVFGNDAKYNDIKTKLAYNLSELFANGNYQITVQAYYKSKTLDGDELLLRSSGTSKNFVKLAGVTDIEVTDGKVTWNYAGEERHYFKLTFTSNSANGGVSVKYTTDNYFDNVVYNTADSVSGIYLSIQVVPGDIEELIDGDYISSLSSEYTEQLSQIAKIPDDGVVTYVDETGNLVVSWLDAMINLVTEVNLNLYKYEVKYKLSADANYTLLKQDEETFVAQSFKDTGELYISIRVIPKNDNYISSAWTQEKSISVPDEISGLEWNEDNYSFTWDEYSANASIEYIIIDEIGHFEDEEFVADKIYRIRANKTDCSYTPFEIGYHRVSVAAIVTNSNVGLLSESVVSDVILLDLFESGSGTLSDPFVITNSTQFSNINYRLTKDNKKLSYFVAVRSEEDPNCEAFATISLGDKYYFAQNNDIVIDSYYESSQLKYNNVSGAFGGVYDGNLYRLILEKSIYKSAIFETISQGAVVKNIELTLDNTDFGENDFAMLAYTNNGDINGIRVLGNVDITNVSNSITMSFITNTNNGNISNVEVLTNCSISGTGLYITINFAPIAINNNGQINWVKSTGDIFIAGIRSVYASGIVVRSANGSIIQNSAYIGNITVSVSGNESSPVYVGGIMAKQEGQTEIHNCYVLGDITIGMGVLNNLTNTFAGGLIGYLAGNLTITNSYAKITKNANTLVGNCYSSIYQLIGKIGAVSISASYVYVPNADGTYSNVAGGSNTTNLINALQNYNDINDLTRDNRGFVKVGDNYELPWSGHLISDNDWKSKTNS